MTAGEQIARESINTRGSLRSVGVLTPNAGLATLVIRNIDTVLRLKALVAAHGRSMEEEARQVLRADIQAAPRTPVVLATQCGRFSGRPEASTCRRFNRDPRASLRISLPDWNPDRPA